MVHPWTDTEDDILQHVWESGTDNPLSRAALLLPNRSKGAIQVRASQKGHSKRRMERLGVTPIPRRTRTESAPYAPRQAPSRAILRPIPLVSGDRDKVRLRLIRTLESLAWELGVSLKSVIATARVLADDDFKAEKELALDAAANGEVSLGASFYPDGRVYVGP